MLRLVGVWGGCAHVAPGEVIKGKQLHHYLQSNLCGVWDKSNLCGVWDMAGHLRQGENSPLLAAAPLNPFTPNLKSYTYQGSLFANAASLWLRLGPGCGNHEEGRGVQADHPG